MFQCKAGLVPDASMGVAWADQSFKGHGRIERRLLVCCPVTARSIRWPGARLILLLRRERRVGDRVTEEYHMAVSSGGVSQWPASALLAAVRGHWGIENRLFHVRDVTLGEDGCRVRTGHAPQVLAALRNVVVSVLDRLGCTNKAAALRRYAAQTHEAIRIVKGEN